MLRLFPAFESRDFRLLWVTNILGAGGMSMGMIAQGWLVLTVTDSAFWVGAVAGVRGIGVVALGALAGVMADRWDRRHILMGAQTTRALSALVLGVLTISGQVLLWHIIVAVAIQGVLQAFYMPANNALTYDAVGPSRVLNANAVRMTGFNIARIAGSIAAGFVIAGFGVGWAYIIVAGIWGLSPVSLLFVRVRNKMATATKEPVWRNLNAGVRYSFSKQGGPIGSLLFLSLLMETFGFSYNVMLPVIARDVLNAGEVGYGLLSAASGVGAFVSTVMVASLGDFRRIGLLMTVMALGAGLGLVLFAASPIFALSLVAVALVGAMLMAYDASMSASLHLSVSDEMRGRVMGLYAFTFGFTPLGGFIAGILATAISAPFAVGLGGVAILAWNLAVQGKVRHIRRDDPATVAGAGEDSGQASVLGGAVPQQATGEASD